MDKTIIGAIQEFIKGKRDEGKRQILRLPLNLTPLL